MFRSCRFDFGTFLRWAGVWHVDGRMDFQIVWIPPRDGPAQHCDVRDHALAASVCGIQEAQQHSHVQPEGPAQRSHRVGRRAWRARTQGTTDRSPTQAGSTGELGQVDPPSYPPRLEPGIFDQ